MGPWIELANGWAAAWAGAIWRASWQGALVIAAAWLLCRAWPQMPPVGRVWLWRLVYAKLVLALVWATPVGLPVLPSPAPAPIAAEQSAPVGPPGPVLSLPAVTAARPLPTNLPADAGRLALPALLLGAWLLAMAGAGWQVWWGHRRSALLRRASLPVEQPRPLRILAEVAGQAGLARPPRLLAGDRGPLVSGLRRPAIVLPEQLLEVADEGQLRLVLAHEVAHLRHRDLQWGWLAWLAQWLFFFHPLVWLAAREWRLAHELACDAWAARSAGVTPAHYGRTLLAVATGLPAPLPQPAAFGVSESYGMLARRLAGMAAAWTPLQRRRAVVAGGLCCVVMAAAVVPWQLQAAPARQTAMPVVSSPAVTGRVVTAAGRPAAGAEVFVYPAGRGGLWLKQRLVADANGRFCRPAEAAALRARLADAATLHTVVVGARQVAVLKLAPHALASISGVVTSEGRPLPGARVSLALGSLDGRCYTTRGAAQAKTAANGQYRFTGLWPNQQYAHFAVVPGYGQRHVSGWLVLRPGEARAAKPIDLPPANAFVAGQVVDEQGKPQAGLRLGAVDGGEDTPYAEVTTDGEGRFRFTGIRGNTLYFSINSRQAMIGDAVIANQSSARLVVGKLAKARPAGVPHYSFVGGRVMVAPVGTAKPAPAAGLPVALTLAGPNRYTTSLAYTTNKVTRPDGWFYFQAPPGTVVQTAPGHRYTIPTGNNGKFVVLGHSRQPLYLQARVPGR